MQNTTAKKGSVFTGFIGALIGAAIGIVIWLIIGKLGFISSLAALLSAVISSKLYDAFGGRQGGGKVFVLIICVLLTVVVGTIGTFYWQSLDLYNEELEECVVGYKQYYGYSDSQARSAAEELMDSTYGGRMGHFNYLMDAPENEGLLAKDMGTGLLFGALGAVGVIAGNGKARKKRKAEEAAAQARAEEARRQAELNAQQNNGYNYGAQPNQYGQASQYSQPNQYNQAPQYSQPNQYGQAPQYNQPNQYNQAPQGNQSGYNAQKANDKKSKLDDNSNSILF